MRTVPTIDQYRFSSPRTVIPVTDPASTIDPQWVTILNLIAKAVIALGSIKIFLVGIYKPFNEWRLQHAKNRKEFHATVTREVLAPELEQLRRIIADESGCAGAMRDVLAQMKAVFSDLDMFLDVAMDNRDRLDETNDLLNAVGFHTDRRIDLKHRHKIDSVMQELTQRSRRRRRTLSVIADTREVNHD